MPKPTEVKEGFGSMLGASEAGSIQVIVQCHDHTLTLMGIPAKKFYSDPKISCDAGALVSGYYDFDSLALGNDAYNIEIEALGGKLVYGEDSMPTIDFREPLIKGPNDLKRLKEKKINFKEDGRFPFVLESSKYVAEYGMSLGSFCSPFSMAVGMCSFAGLIKFIRKKPDFVHDLLEFIVDDVIIPWLEVQKNSSGILMAIGVDAWASVPNLSVEEMWKWVVPYNRRLIEKAKKIGVLVSNVSGDYCEERIEKFDPEILYGCFDIQLASQANPTLFLLMGRWYEYPLEAVRDYTKRFRDEGKTITVTAGVNARLLRDGPIEKIVDNVKSFINAFGKDHDLSITLANIPADAPSDHIHAAVAAVHTYGKFPIADNLDEIEFKMPKMPSFDEWRKTVNKPLPKITVRRGLANLLWMQMAQINKNAKFKELYADKKMTFLYDLTDQRYASLITVENGSLDVKHIDKTKEKLEDYEVDAAMKCSTELFFDFGSGKISKIGIVGKMITGKLKISGMKKMQELQRIMDLPSEG